MKCVYCAEEIKDEAVFCRFCGAVREAGEWKPPQLLRRGAAASSARPGRFTMLTAGAFFLLSAAFELLGVTSDVPLFGAVRSGAVAVLYHVVYIALFLAMGVGLLTGRRWGYWAVLGGTLFYTLDRALLLLDRKAMEAYLEQQLQGSDALEMLGIDMDTLMLGTTLLTAMVLVCWWGFAFFVYLRRTYFRS